jgi:endonuclease VIII
VPEGDTLARIADVLGRVLVDQTVTAARGRPGGVDLGRAVGHRVTSVESRGKHLLIEFSNGLTLHTHLAMPGSWHRYRAGERWQRPAASSVAVIETESAIAVCFDAPTVELLDTRALAIHSRLSRLGSDLAHDDFDADAALAALRAPGRAGTSVGDALLDQRALAGLGNVYRSELCFLEHVNPFTPVSEVSDEVLRRLVERGARLVKQNSSGGARVTTDAGTPGNLHVYGRTGRPCRRCGTMIGGAVATAFLGANPRRVYWCPSCQPQAIVTGRTSKAPCRETRRRR